MKLCQLYVLDSCIRWQNNLLGEITEDSKEETVARTDRPVPIVACLSHIHFATCLYST
jgi:hypothetical protein